MSCVRRVARKYPLDVQSFGYFKGTEFSLNARPTNNHSTLVDSPVPPAEQKHAPGRCGFNLSLKTPIGIANFISVLPIYCNGRRLPSRSVKFLEKLILNQVKRIPHINLLDMLKSMNHIAFHSTALADVCTFFVEDYYKELSGCNRRLVQEIALELCEMCRDKDIHGKYLAIASELIDEASTFQMLRLWKQYKSYPDYATMYSNQVLQMSQRLMEFNVNVRKQYTIDDCNAVADILDIASKCILHICPKDSDLSTGSMHYIVSTLYPCIIAGINRFTANNIVTILDVVASLGPLYNEELVDALCGIYIKHLAQYSVDNMIRFNTRLLDMQINKPLVLLETMLIIPRIESSISTVDHLIGLFNIFTRANFASEYLRQLMGQLALQLAHKYSKQHAQQIYDCIARYNYMCLQTSQQDLSPPHPATLADCGSHISQSLRFGATSDLGSSLCDSTQQCIKEIIHGHKWGCSV